MHNSIWMNIRPELISQHMLATMFVDMYIQSRLAERQRRYVGVSGGAE